MSESNREDDEERNVTGRSHFWNPSNGSHLAEGPVTTIVQSREGPRSQSSSTLPRIKNQDDHEDREEERELMDILPSSPLLLPVEMQAIFTYVCYRCHSKISTYHEVTSVEQLQKMCPQCNAVGYSLAREVKGKYRHEFAVEFVLVPHGAVEYDDTGDVRLPFDRRKERTIFRTLVKVRKKYPMFGKTLIIQTKLDPGDRELQGMDLILVYLLRHEQRVAWADLRKNPTPALDEHHSPFNTSFEYHPS